MRLAVSSADKDKAIDIVTRAFAADPVFNWIVKQDHKRCDRIRLLVATLVDMAFPLGGTYLSAEELGAAVWVPPGGHALSSIQQAKVLALLGRTAGCARIIEMARFFNYLNKHQPREPFFHLLFLGVVPEAQGRGIGTSLLEPMLAQCDNNNYVAYLENSHGKNLPLYEHHGFRSLPDRLEFQGPPLWLMRREPKHRSLV